MVRSFLVAASILALAGCNGTTNPIFDIEPEDDVNGGVVDNGLPEEVAGNLARIQFDPDTDTFRAEIYANDASTRLATFNRDAARDIAGSGFQTYAYDEGNLLRHYMALAKEAPRGTVLAATVADGGQFNTRYGGGYYTQLTPFSAPSGAGALASYTGTYVGLFAPGALVPSGLPDEMEPGETYRVQGDILINAGFADRAVEGGITNRTIIETTTALEGIVLRVTDIASDGSFVGNVEFYGDPGNVIGSYGGTFGGTNASDVAGVLEINPIRGSNGVWENGAFVLGKCGLAGEGALCAEN